MLIETTDGKKQIEIPTPKFLGWEEMAYEEYAKKIVEFVRKKDVWEVDFFGLMNLSLWERDFLSSIHAQLQRGKTLSEKQMNIIRKIARKSRLIAKADVRRRKIIFFLVEKKKRTKVWETDLEV